jgi:hypothetical protein
LQKVLTNPGHIKAQDKIFDYLKKVTPNREILFYLDSLGRDNPNHVFLQNLIIFYRNTVNQSGAGSSSHDILSHFVKLVADSQARPLHPASSVNPVNRNIFNAVQNRNLVPNFTASPPIFNPTLTHPGAFFRPIPTALSRVQPAMSHVPNISNSVINELYSRMKNKDQIIESKDQEIARLRAELDIRASHDQYKENNMTHVNRTPLQSMPFLAPQNPLSSENSFNTSRKRLKFSSD